MLNPSSPKNLSDTTWKILIIDDDEDDFIIVRDMLKQARGRKIEVHWSATYESGRRELAGDPYDAVLVDYDLGVHKGIEIIREANDQGYASPLILFTGRGGYEVDLEAMQAGATLYLTKDEANPLLLERVIRYAIEIKQKETTLQESEEKFAKAFHASPAGQLITRRSDGLIVDVNASYEQLLGYSRAELIGHQTTGLNIYLNPQERDRVLGILKTEGRVYNLEMALRNKAGNLVSILGSIEAITIGGEVYLLSTLIDITERKQTEDELRRSEAHLRESERVRREADERFRLALRKAPVSVAAQDRDLRYIWAYNQRSASLDQIIGHFDHEIFTAEEVEHFTAIKRRVLEEGIEQREQLWLDRPTGRMYLDICWEPIRDNAGSIVGVASATVDLTPMKLAEEALLESEGKYRTLFENSPEAVFLTRPDGSVQAANPAACAMFGWTEEEIIGLGRSGILDTEDPRLAEALEIRKQSGRFQAREYTAIRKGGERFPVEVDSVILPGEPNRSFVILRDITGRKQSEKALQESEERERHRAHELAAVLDAVPAYIFITHDPDSRYMAGNRATHELLRSEPGANLSMSAPEQDFPRPLRVMRDGQEIPPEEMPVQLAARKCIRVEDYEFDVVFDDGDHRQLMGNAAPLCDEHGNPAGAVGAFIDITELRRIEKETSERIALMEVQRRLLEHREMERMQLARDLHDGPIQSLGGLGFSLQLLQNTVENQEARDMVEQVKQNVRDLAGELRGVCNELRPPLLQRFGFRKAVQAHIDGFREKHPEIRLDLDMTEQQEKLPENIAIVLYRIYQEALNNIVHHAEATEISIHFTFDPRQILLEIRDNGKGFPEKIDWVELVRQGHFGLVGMKERAEAIGGSIEVLPVPEKGTTIRVVVPVQMNMAPGGEDF